MLRVLNDDSTHALCFRSPLVSLFDPVVVIVNEGQVFDKDRLSEAHAATVTSEESSLVTGMFTQSI